MLYKIACKVPGNFFFHPFNIQKSSFGSFLPNKTKKGQYHIAKPIFNEIKKFKTGLKLVIFIRFSV
jgi:hypothetical protein